MWLNGFSFGLQIERHWCLPVSIVSVTLAALFAVWLSNLPAVCALPLAAMACLQGGWALAGRCPERGIAVDSAGRITSAGHAGRELRLIGRPWIIPAMAIGFQLADRDGRISSLIILRVQLSGDTWRRLLVRIRRN
jgi:hypothetical protein